jgi:hypothetical protein
MATPFGQAFIFAIKFCHDYGIQMTDQQMHDFCNLLIEFRDGSHPTKQERTDGEAACPYCAGKGEFVNVIGKALRCNHCAAPAANANR